MAGRNSIVVLLLAVAMSIGIANASSGKQRKHHHPKASNASAMCAQPGGCDAKPQSAFDMVVADVKSMSQRPARDDEAVMVHIKANKNALPPPFLFELSRRLFARDRQESLYYLYLATMRAAYDGARCRDKSAIAGSQAVITALATQLQPINDYLATKPDLGPTFRLLQERNELFTSRASPWWICSHGIAVEVAGDSKTSAHADAWLAPVAEWPRAQAEVWHSLIEASKKADGD